MRIEDYLTYEAKDGAALESKALDTIRQAFLRFVDDAPPHRLDSIRRVRDFFQRAYEIEHSMTAMLDMLIKEEDEAGKIVWPDDEDEERA